MGQSDLCQFQFMSDSQGLYRSCSQLALFARPQNNSFWTTLSSDAQRKIVRLLAQILRQYRGKGPRQNSQRRPRVSDKIKPHHVERKAMLYVRQSSAYQVQNKNRETHRRTKVGIRYPGPAREGYAAGPSHGICLFHGSAIVWGQRLPLVNPYQGYARAWRKPRPSIGPNRCFMNGRAARTWSLPMPARLSRPNCWP